MSEMIERTCEICGEPVSGCGYVLRTICSPACYGVRDKRQRHAEDRRIVRAWEERFNRHLPEGAGFWLPYLEDDNGRWRPWYKLPHLRDLAKEYRIYERIAALKAAGKKRRSEKGVNALNRAAPFDRVARDLLGDDCLVIAADDDGVVIIHDACDGDGCDDCRGTGLALAEGRP